MTTKHRVSLKTGLSEDIVLNESEETKHSVGKDISAIPKPVSETEKNMKVVKTIVDLLIEKRVISADDIDAETMSQLDATINITK